MIINPVNNNLGVKHCFTPINIYNKTKCSEVPAKIDLKSTKANDIFIITREMLK